MAVSNASLAVISGLVGNSGSQTAFTYVANGSGSTTYAASQTALVAENVNTYGFGRAAATVSRTTTTQTNDTLTYAKTWTASGDVTVRELGIFNDSSTGTMLHRTVLAADKSISSGETFTLAYTVVFS
jgi:hypothetical protein